MPAVRVSLAVGAGGRTVGLQSLLCLLCLLCLALPTTAPALHLSASAPGEGGRSPDGTPSQSRDPGAQNITRRPTIHTHTHTHIYEYGAGRAKKTRVPLSCRRRELEQGQGESRVVRPLPGLAAPTPTITTAHLLALGI